MPNTQNTPNIRLPKGWTKHVRSAVVHVLSLAPYAAAYTRSWAMDSRSGRVRVSYRAWYNAWIRTFRPS